MTSYQPDLEELQKLSKTLQTANISHALGGSGLLWALGISVEVNDWDITTTCPLEHIESALQDYDYVVHYANGIYASDYLIKIVLKNSHVDIIGNFAIKTKTEVISINTIITGYWNDVPLGCPYEWHKAYSAMKRTHKIELLAKYLLSNPQ